jgi:hypothetical protein
MFLSEHNIYLSCHKFQIQMFKQSLTETTGSTLIVSMGQIHGQIPNN